MISIEMCKNADQIPEVVKLVFYSMRNKYTSVSNPDGLTFKEVRSILKNQSVSVIKNDDQIIGIVRTSFADSKIKSRLDLDSTIDYFYVGMIYISQKFRGNGFAGDVLSIFLKEHKNILYLAHQSNVSSNKVGSKYLKFFKKYSSFGSFEPYNVYKIEQ